MASQRSGKILLGGVIYFDDFDPIWEGAGAVLACEHSYSKVAFKEMLEDWSAETATGTGESDFGDGRHDEFVLLRRLVMSKDSIMLVSSQLSATSWLSLHILIRGTNGTV